MKRIVIAAALLAVACTAVAQSPSITVTERGEAAFKSNGC